MQILSRDTLPLGGFAGLLEHRLVTDSRVFSGRKSPETWEGLGNFVYLADAKFNPKGETGMHSHKEIDVISVMVEGCVSHEGSLEHGKSLDTGDVQVQRAGGEGFAHNEVNPDDSQNRLIQLWVLPEQQGEPAGYKYYSPKQSEETRIYGGDKSQTDTFDSRTIINIVKLDAGQSVTLTGEHLTYVTGGEARFVDGEQSHQAVDGDLIRSDHCEVTAATELQMIVVTRS
ncbi:MAG: pilus assembly protein [Alteromonadaceae bacterium]|nr:MAG: pilus assembly protein [Alteromonadaceae bacterium]